MKNCRTCKHWQQMDAPTRRFDNRFNDDDVSDCAVPWSPDSGICRKAAMAAHGPDPFDDSLMFVQDGSDYRACLATRGTFGCVLHEPRPER